MRLFASYYIVHVHEGHAAKCYRKRIQHKMMSLALMYVYYIVDDDATSPTEFHGHLAFKV